MNEIPSKFWFKEQSSDAVQAWRWLFNTANLVASSPESEDRNAVLEAIVGCLWSLGRGLGRLKFIKITNPCHHLHVL